MSEPGAALLVRVEEVVDARLVLVDRLLDHPQPERAGVEVDVALRLGGDRGDVVDALELHLRLLVRSTKVVAAINYIR